MQKLYFWLVDPSANTAKFGEDDRVSTQEDISMVVWTLNFDLGQNE